MNEETYPFESPRIEFRYEFTSVSVQKQVKKVVRLRPTDIEGLYNLVLLDILPDGTTSDTAETNNQDMVVILATVMRIAVDFLSKNHDSSIAIQGSDARRQRLYQILISRELDVIRQQFNILGGNGNQVEPFRRNRSYEFLIVSKRE